MMRIIVFLTGLMVGMAQGCPIVYHSDIGVTLQTVGQQNAANIYFCQQMFSASTRETSILPTELSPRLSGGTLSDAFGNGNNTEDITVSTTELTGRAVPDLNLGQVTRTFPTSGTGRYGKSSIFNFYTLVKPRGWGRNTCYRGNGGNQYDAIKRFLRNNASMFQASTPSTGTQNAVASYTGNTVAVIYNLALENSLGDTVRADLYFEHSNPTSGQYFTSRNANRRMCWVGIKTRMVIKTDTPPNRSGDYTVNVRVRN